MDVERALGHVERVPGVSVRDADPAVRTDRLAKLRHVHLDAVLRRLRRLVSPQDRDEFVDGHDLPAMQQQRSQQGATLPAPERDATFTVDHLERSEDPEFHPSSRATVRTLARTVRATARATARDPRLSVP